MRSDGGLKDQLRILWAVSCSTDTLDSWRVAQLETRLSLFSSSFSPRFFGRHVCHGW